MQPITLTGTLGTAKTGIVRDSIHFSPLEVQLRDYCMSVTVWYIPRLDLVSLPFEGEKQFSCLNPVSFGEVCAVSNVSGQSVW